MSALKIRMVFAIMAIMFAGMGIVALPYAVSLLTGQHTWYDISSEEYNQIPCKKCHADVYEEMMSMEPLSKKLAGSSSPHSYMDENCELCHRTCFNNTFSRSSGKYEKSPGFTYASGSGTGSRPGVEAHAVSTIECMDCHGIPDGGYWENVVNLITKYGAVPKEVMPETNSSGNTGLMNALIARKLRTDAVKLRGKLKEVMESLEARDFGTCRVGEVVLMQSTLSPAGPTYTPIHHAPLGRGKR